ncbi:hypothetical protein PCO86_14785 [Pectobacteriaceae bacterium CE70]|nr:hypothetical protein PCO87_15175 [Pectobacteriaceae bacterium C52]WJV65575.1 hypothetical protein PCO86_14785 [Pectobacteriaceae bacterium CE70]WJY09596.1 hypothetical protein PCO80_14705 [Pectobacteriaceae bacterium C80]
MSVKNKLTPELKQRFLDSLEKHGISQTKVITNVVTTGPKNYLSDRPGVGSLIPANKIAIHTLDELKALAGNSDDDYAKGVMQVHLHEDLPAWKKSKNGHAPDKLSVEENENIVKAFKTYIYGDSAKVASYKDIIHQHFFPMTLATYAAENLTVKSGEVLTVDGSKAVATFGTVTVEQGGSISYEVDASWTVQSMIFE